ncbi:MAG: hypothetical protein H0V66_03750 [Bdellovibrionales bacterium]|nr:hypothetical protein [Bdellovibrionales bacterium]
MNIKVHYITTLCALFFLGVMINPGTKGSAQNDEHERSCKMVKGRMDCIYKYSEYRINKNSEVQYKLN